MEPYQMRQLLISIQRSANEGDCRAVRDLACAGLTFLDGSDVEAHEAWKEIVSGGLTVPDANDTTLPRRRAPS